MSSIKFQFHCDVERQTIKPSTETLRYINGINNDDYNRVEGLDALGDLSVFITQLYNSLLTPNKDDSEALQNHETTEQVLEKWKVE